MRLISENDEQAIARHRAKEEIRRAIRTLTANLLRVTRGAGRPYDLPKQTHRLSEAFTALAAADGSLDPAELNHMLDLEDRELMAKLKDREWAWEHAQITMVHGALQMAASELMGQRTQYAAGQTELFNGLATIERQREENSRSMGLRGKKRKLTPSDWG